MTKKKGKQLEDYLPLSESSFYILLTLTKPLHGYAMMQEIEDSARIQLRSDLAPCMAQFPPWKGRD